ncbi:MAG TPA: pyridoxal phosphate-dependent aminotransferase [Pseudomonadota bacterium]|nr:pyridoxal phosphate-dependent aminotransferase [Pseudomonadota bacterium]
MRTSRRVDALVPSITLEIAARTRQLSAAGRDIVSLTLGEPDFPTPEYIRQAACTAIERGVSRYTPVCGIPELRAAAAKDLSAVHGIPIASDEVMVSTGAKQCLFNVLQALLDDGEEVLVPTPTWPSHVELIRLAGGVPVLCPSTADQGFRLNVDLLRAKITPATRILLLASPCNPTGVLIDEGAMKQVVALLHENPHVVVLTDDLYRRLVYSPGRFVSLLRLDPSLWGRVILVDGVSKTYAMTGWRIGFCAAPRSLIAAMDKLQGQVTTNAASVSQHAALGALTGDQTEAKQMVAEFDARRKAMCRGLASIKDVRCVEPEGTFYCFPDVSAYLGGSISDDAELSRYLLEEASVAVVPGSGFFAPGHIRLSYSASVPVIEEGLRRLSRGLLALKN